MRNRFRASLVVAAIVVLPMLAIASPINKLEPNDTPATAQNIDLFFSLDSSPDIHDGALTNTSTTIPHVTVNAFGANAAGNGTFDWYSFLVPAGGGLAIFDIDYGLPDFDPWIRLLNSALATVADNDDGGLIDPGSVHSFDSFIQTNLTAGTYYIGVGRFCCFAEVPAGADYALQVSVEGHEVPDAIPEPGTLLLIGTGAVGLAARIRRRRRA